MNPKLSRRHGVDVVGHFGSRFGYATHAVQLARALRREGLLAACVNLDDEVLADYADLAVHLGRLDLAMPPRVGMGIPTETVPHADVAILLTAPSEATGAFALAYKAAALFLCPNTDQLSAEAIETAAAFPRLIAPSRYCAATIAKHTAHRNPAPRVDVLPLGVDDVFFEGRRTVAARAERRRDRNEPLRFVHFTTDWFWPGRKGTEELLRAWRGLMDLYYQHPWRPSLVVHTVPAMRDTVYYAAADLQLFEPELVVVDSSTPRGALPHELFEHMANADMVIAPSRAEGYGMIPLAALAAGVPLLTTCVTGEADFLPTRHPPEATFEDGGPGWRRIPSGPLGVLEGEDGLCPTVDPDAIVAALRSACEGDDGELTAMRMEQESFVRRLDAWRSRWAFRLDHWVAYARDLMASIPRRVSRWAPSTTESNEQEDEGR